MRFGQTFLSDSEIMERANREGMNAISTARSDNSRTEQWKKREIARAWLKIAAKRDELLESRDAKRRAYQRELEQEIFGEGSTSDPAWTISRRDAADRASRLDNPSHALALLARADRSQDEPLARAIAEVAFERRWPEVVNTFLDSRPALVEPFEELWNQTHPSLTEQFIGQALLHSKPQELQGMDDYQIRALADWDMPPERQVHLAGQTRPTI